MEAGTLFVACIRLDFVTGGKDPKRLSPPASVCWSEVS